MTSVEAAHAAHGALDEHVLDKIAAGLRVSVTTLEGRYDEHLRAREVTGASITLTSREKAAIRGARSFLAAHAILAVAGRHVTFAHLERAIWRDGGDRTLTTLREAERARRAAARRTPGCATCVADGVAA